MPSNIFVQQHALQVLNVKDYGAQGNGTTDDTAAIQAAISTAVNAGGGIVYLPAGIYKTTAALTLSGNNVILQGAGGVSGNTNASRLGATVIKPSSGATYDAIVTQLPATVGTAGYVYYGLGVRDLAVDCSQMAGTVAGQGNGVHFYGVRYGLLDHVHVFNSPNWAFLIEGDSTNYAYNTDLYSCIAGQCAAGFRFTNSEQCCLYRCIVEGASTACAAAQPYSGSQSSTVSYMLYGNVGWIMAQNCGFGTSGTYTNEAVHLDNGESAIINGCLFDSVHGPAIYTVAGGHIITNNTLNNPCKTTAGAAISLGAGAHTVTGNVIQAAGAHMTYSVEERGAYTPGNVIQNNQFVAGTSGVVSLNTATKSQVKNNIGYQSPNYPFNVKEFGATGNGTTDDTSAIQAAITAAQNAGGGRVFFPIGTYSISAPLAIAASGIRLEGASRASVNLRFAASFTGAALISITADKCGVSDLSITGASSTISSNPAALGILVSGARYAFLDDLEFQYVNGYCIKVAATTNAACFGAHIDHIHEVNCAGGIHLLGNMNQSFGMQAWLSNLNLEIATTLECLRIEDCNDVLVSNIGGAAGQGAATNSALHILGACSSVFITAPDLGVYPGGNSAPVCLIESGANGSPSGVELHAGVLQAGTTPLSITSGANLRFVGVTFKRAQADGTDVSNLTGECTFEDCTWMTNGVGGGTVYDINITTATSWVHIKNGICASPVGSGANLVTNAINDTNHRAYVQGVHFSGTGITPSTVFASVPQIVRNCPGYNPRGQITAGTIGASPYTTTAGQNDITVIFTAVNGLTAFKIAGTSIGAVPQVGVPYRIPARQSIEVDWATTAPTWVWIAD